MILSIHLHSIFSWKTPAANHQQFLTLCQPNMYPPWRKTWKLWDVRICCICCERLSWYEITAKESSFVILDSCSDFLYNIHGVVDTSLPLNLVSNLPNFSSYRGSQDRSKHAILCHRALSGSYFKYSLVFEHWQCYVLRCFVLLQDIKNKIVTTLFNKLRN